MGTDFQRTDLFLFLSIPNWKLQNKQSQRSWIILFLIFFTFINLLNSLYSQLPIFFSLDFILSLTYSFIFVSLFFVQMQNNQNIWLRIRRRLFTCFDSKAPKLLVSIYDCSESQNIYLPIIAVRSILQKWRTFPCPQSKRTSAASAHALSDTSRKVLCFSFAFLLFIVKLCYFPLRRSQRNHYFFLFFSSEYQL